ncbi:hypothetical protein RUMHYD_03536 [Blautia hydrogenotrophica DSM 10507]|uniref:Uncharacterized protein n=1 Tax=Blautia hydrogenotrophica (strain DSM 10507 / JCM 14656 / S5a33) TaxID=476272 RepID=C0CRM2_BLAHS|nr:hypothetical protein RUMHYD_03536 [Blautia hydrogenotrophica DSM 10507]
MKNSCKNGALSITSLHRCVYFSLLLLTVSGISQYSSVYMKFIPQNFLIFTLFYPNF